MASWHRLRGMLAGPLTKSAIIVAGSRIVSFVTINAATGRRITGRLDNSTQLCAVNKCQKPIDDHSRVSHARSKAMY
jgi:hypothetical protein